MQGQQLLLSHSLVLDTCIWKALHHDIDRLHDTAYRSEFVHRVLRDLDMITGISGPFSVFDVKSRCEKMRRDVGRLDELKNDLGITQRTPEWYEARHKLVTASDIAQALDKSKFGNQTDFFVKKVAPVARASDEVPDKDTGAPLVTPESIPPLKWGTMYEDVAVLIYTTRNKMKLYEFGLLCHPNLPLGASPDGITETGVMLEIKCPFRRKIDGEVPLQYYYQIMGQLEVCGLEHCDFLECKLSEYPDEEEFWQDVLVDEGCDAATLRDDAPGLPGTNGREKGVVAEFLKPDLTSPEPGASTFSYEYLSVLCPSKKEFRAWRDDMLVSPKPDGSVFRRFHFWRLETYSVVRVTRDADLVNDMLKQVKGVWDRVLRYRADPAAFQEYLEETEKGKHVKRRPSLAAATAAPTSKRNVEDTKTTRQTFTTPSMFVKMDGDSSDDAT